MKTLFNTIVLLIRLELSFNPFGLSREVGERFNYLRAGSIVLLSLTSLSSQAMEFPRESAVPGGIVIVNLDVPEDATPQSTLNDARVLTIKTEHGWKAVIGIALTTQAGKLELYSSYRDKRVVQSIDVHDKYYQTQTITIQDQRKVEPAPEDLERIDREAILKTSLRSTWTEQPPALEFQPPLAGPISSIFGLRRIFNGQPRDPHNGLDIAAPAGTLIHAPAHGKVLYAGNFFFDGNMVYLDHGAGLISIYAHMQKITVNKGQRVEQGESIGTVGQTGRATGPHLHWGVYLNNTAVDPSLFLFQDTYRP